jgi:hypothetical protein
MAPRCLGHDLGIVFAIIQFNIGAEIMDLKVEIRNFSTGNMGLKSGKGSGGTRRSRWQRKLRDKRHNVDVPAHPCQDYDEWSFRRGASERLFFQPTDRCILIGKFEAGVAGI